MSPRYGISDGVSWRRSGQQANRQNQEARSGTNTPTRDGGRQQAMAALSGNAWGGAKGKAAGGAERPGAQQAPLGQSDSHVPVKDFNAAEVKRYLKKSTLIILFGALHLPTWS